MTVYATKLYEKGNDPNYEKLIQVYNMIFPISVEEKYVDLVNAIYDYWNNSSILTSTDIKINQNIKEISELTDELKQIIARKKQYAEELNSINKQMIELVESGNYALLKKLVDKAEHLSNSLITLGARTETKIDSNREAVTDKHITANEARSNLDNSVCRIQEIMLEINNLLNGGTNRIDNFEITQKHLDLIDSLECAADVKQIFKLKLISQFNFRVEAFKCFQEYALLILEQYKNRSLHIDDKITQKAAIAASGLEEYGLSDSVFSSIKDWSNLTPFVLENEYIKSLSADMVADFLRTGTIPKEKMDTLEKNATEIRGNTLQSAISSCNIESEYGTPNDYSGNTSAKK